MKRIVNAVILLLGLSMVSTMTSCNKASNYNEKIVGEWLMTKYSYYEYDLTGTLIEKGEYIYEEGDYYDEEDYIWKFFSEGKVSMSSGWFQKKHGTMIVDYLIDGNTLFIIDNEGEVDEEWTYTIKELTNSTMVLEQEEEWNSGRYVGRRDFKKLK